MRARTGGGHAPAERRIHSSEQRRGLRVQVYGGRLRLRQRPELLLGRQPGCMRLGTLQRGTKVAAAVAGG